MTLPPLREWQQSALSLWKTNGFRGIFAVATGGGKTLFSLSARQEFLTANSTTPTLIVVPTTALLDQWYVEVCEVAGVNDSDIKVLHGKDLVPDKQVNLVVINTARRITETVSQYQPVLLIVDECHRAGSEENARALSVQSVASIGLSATPRRDFDDGLNRYLVPAIGPILFEYSLADAIRDGVLANLQLRNIRVPLLQSEQRHYDQLTRRIAQTMRDGDQQSLEMLLRARARLYNSAFYRVPVARSVMRTRRGNRTLVFLESIDLAQTLLAELQEDGHSVTIYHSRQTAALRRSNLRLFRRGVFDVLITCRALDEGFNVPEATTALVVAGTSSRRQRTQRIGRVLRVIEDKSNGEVITIYATPIEERRLAEESEVLGLSSSTTWAEANVNI